VNSDSALYVGRVIHHRLRPRRHSLGYRAHWMLLDLDELDSLGLRSRFFSHNRFNLFSFYDADYGNCDAQPLRRTIERQLASAGIAFDGGAIRLLTMPRLLGYAFNPLSIYFCHRQNGSLAALLYEVRNTFGERHSYLIAASETDRGIIRQHCDKQFYVSPFLGLDMRYDFSVAEPGETVRVVVRGSDEAGALIVASLVGHRKPLTDGNLLRLLFTHPLMTLKVTLGIHWEALRLWLKGVRLEPKPTAPKQPVTVGPAPSVLRRSA
jgi:DUF1365 family protein